MDAQALKGHSADGKLKSSKIMCTMAGENMNAGIILQRCTGKLYPSAVGYALMTFAISAAVLRTLAAENGQHQLPHQAQRED